MTASDTITPSLSPADVALALRALRASWLIAMLRQERTEAGPARTELARTLDQLTALIRTLECALPIPLDR